jgi:hypothetical protein
MIEFTEEEKALLHRYLRSYQRLVAGELPANTAARRRFVEVANRQLSPIAVHEVAFVKWQMWIGLRPYEPLRPLAEKPATTIAVHGVAVARHDREVKVSAASGCHSDKSAESTWDRVATWFNASLGTDFARQLDQWMRDTFATSKSTIYDKAMDAAHITSPSGPFHRLWDGGHSLSDAWRAVVDARPDDSFSQEVTGYLSAIWKDVITPMGLPLATINRNWFNSTHVGLSNFGITKSQLADALSYTGSELAGAVLGAIALLLNWDGTETERAATLAGSLGMSTICAANPLLGIVAMVCLARAVQTAKAAKAKVGLTVGVLKGGFGSAALVATSAIVGGPVWVGLVVGIVVSILVHNAVCHGAKQIATVDWDRVCSSVMDMFRNRDRGGLQLLVKLA